MDITQHPGPDWLELRLAGRLDTTWAEHVSATIEAAVQAGSHQIVLNFSRVEYISSLGIRVLLTHFKRLKSVNGQLSVSEPSNATLSILRATGLAGILVTEAVVGRPETAPDVTSLVLGSARYEIYPQVVSTPLSCAAVGRPERLVGSGYEATDCRALDFPLGTFGLGLGAFGDGFADCRDRFGEFLAAGGCAITLPTNEAPALPDYVVEQGHFIPRVETLYALVGAGDFPTMVRFDAHDEGTGKIGLSELVDALLEISSGEFVAFAVLAEAAGLVGATLRRSPATGPVSLELPGVRDCLSFSSERIGERGLALLVGFAANEPPPEAARFLRPLGVQPEFQAHVHAALFPYRPVQRGELPFAETVASVLGTSTPQTLMHLMSDTRPYDGIGETDLVRGACWVGPVTAITPQ
jgi:anti-anti-sigma factor